MGVASYRRGSEVVARGVRADHDPYFSMSSFDRSVAILRDDINSNIPPGGVSLFASTVARFDPNDGWFLMNRRDDGWGEYAIPMSLRDVRKRYRVRLGTFGYDEHSFLIEVERIR